MLSWWWDIVVVLTWRPWYCWGAESIADVRCAAMGGLSITDHSVWTGYISKYKMHTFHN